MPSQRYHTLNLPKGPLARRLKIAAAINNQSIVKYVEDILTRAVSRTFEAAGLEQSKPHKEPK